jgi:hypothetical protein
MTGDSADATGCRTAPGRMLWADVLQHGEQRLFEFASAFASGLGGIARP